MHLAHDTLIFTGKTVEHISENSHNKIIVDFYKL